MNLVGTDVKITSSGRGCTSNALKPSTSLSSRELSLATIEARPAYSGVYSKVAVAVAAAGTSGTYKNNNNSFMHVPRT